MVGVQRHAASRYIGHLYQRHLAILLTDVKLQADGWLDVLGELVPMNCRHHFFMAWAVRFASRYLDGSRFAWFHPDHRLLKSRYQTGFPDLECQGFISARGFKYRPIIQSASVVNHYSITIFCLWHGPLLSASRGESKMLYSEVMQRATQLLTSGTTLFTLLDLEYHAFWMLPQELQNCLASPHFLQTP
jgi:hypothetical protein